ncbi:MAG: translocation/assembly module TamB domain-containing protein [Geminicoccaceae bacterium]
MLRKLAISIGLLLGLVLLLLAGAFGLAQTRFGQDRLAALIASQLGTPEAPAEVDGLSGFVPFDIGLRRLALRDPTGVWLEVEDARLKIRPAALLHGAVEVETVGARRVALDHLPPSPPSSEPFALPQLPQLPRSLPAVAIDRLYLGTLALGAPVLGQAAEFSLDGHGSAGATGATLGLQLARTDQPTARASLDAGLDLASQQLRLDLQASETGGLLAATTGRPDAGDLTLALQGDGPLADWRGRLDLDAERLAKAGLDLELAHAEAWRLALTGALDAAPGLLPPDIDAAMGSRVELSLAARETAPNRVRLDELRLSAGALTATGEGEFDLGAQTLRASLALAAPDLAPFSGLAATPLAGRADLRLDASGAFVHPELALDLAASGLAAGPAGLSRLTGKVGVMPPASPTDNLTATARIAGEGVQLDGRQLGDGKLELALDGALSPGRQARLSSLTLRSDLAEASASGSFDLDRRAGSARLDARLPDLAAVTGALAAPTPVSGAFALGADVTIEEALRAIDVALTGGGTGLSGLPPGAQELVGATPTLAARIHVEPESAVTVEQLRIDGAGVQITGDPRLGLPDQTLGGGLRLAVPDLAPLQAALKQPVAGALDLRAGLGGTIPVPEITLDGAVDRLVAGGQAIDRVTLAGRLLGPLDTPSGHARLAAMRQKQELAVATDYRLANDLMSLTGLTLEGPATRLAGKLDVALAGPLARGNLSGGVRDLAALQPWLGRRLAGAVDLNLTLATPRDRQDATLRVAATGVGSEFGSLQRADLAATLGDLFGRGTIGADLTATGLVANELAVDRTVLKVGGRLAALDLNATTSGNQAGKPFQLDAQAAVEPLGPRQRVQLTRLEGQLAGETLRLAAPATVTVQGQRIDLDRLDLALGPARLTGNLALGDSQVRGELALASLPLGALERFGAPRLAGTVEARVDLAGTRRAPEVTLSANVAKAALDPAAPTKLDARLGGRLAGDRLQANLAVTGLGAQPLTLDASLPARFSLDPPGFVLAQDAALSGRLAGPVDLATVAHLVTLDGTQVAGVVATDLALAGTLLQPRLDGTVALDDGTLQDLRSGVRLSKIALHAQAQGDRLTIDRLSATDPTGGTLNGRGAVRLLAGGDVAFDLSVDAARARLLDNTLGVVILSGTASATGNPGNILARADLTLDRGDFQIPDSVGPSVPTMEVTEVRDGAPVEQATRSGPPMNVAFDIKLDAPARLFVRGRGLDSEWSGKIALTGDLAAPLVEGQLDIRRGFLDLLDRRFQIERGVITFVGSSPPVPMIDLSATATTSNVTVTVTAQGPATDPKITLSSEPPLPQDEILSHLLFGTSVARITPMQGLRLAAALDDLRGDGFVSSAFTKVRRAIGLDTLDVQSTETTDESGETSSDTTARAGKYVTDQVYIEGERSVTTGASKARVKVDLTPNLSVGTTVDDQAQTGVGLQWRYDY